MVTRLAVSGALPWLAIVLIAGPGRAGETSRRTSADQRIRYYSSRLAEHPRLYPVHAQLGEAYLDKARETFDPVWLGRAHSALLRSHEIQPNYPAMKLMAALAAYRHRFEEALEWVERASRTSPDDPDLAALGVEALLGLGRVDRARALLPPPGEPPEHFSEAAALGQWLLSQERYDEAVELFRAGAELARRAGAPAGEAWAEVRAAGAFLDSGRPEEALPHLERAEALDPESLDLRLHRSEYLEARGEIQAALRMLEKVARGDPEVHRRAYLLSRRLGRERAAARHLAAATRGLERPAEAGEVYTLGALAQLYCDAGLHLDRALELARRNLVYQRDGASRAALACVVEKMGRAGE